MIMNATARKVRIDMVSIKYQRDHPVRTGSITQWVERLG